MIERAMDVHARAGLPLMQMPSGSGGNRRVYVDGLSNIAIPAALPDFARPSATEERDRGAWVFLVGVLVGADAVMLVNLARQILP